MGYKHDTVPHADKVYVLGNAHTNTIEGFWYNCKTVLAVFIILSLPNIYKIILMNMLSGITIETWLPRCFSFF
ncbi:MAG TPA: transposase [Anaerolineae bacterium]|nr:transposase [Anaerolineae bacterium]